MRINTISVWDYLLSQDLKAVGVEKFFNNEIPASYLKKISQNQTLEIQCVRQDKIIFRDHVYYIFFDGDKDYVYLDESCEASKMEETIRYFLDVSSPKLIRLYLERKFTYLERI